MTSDVGWMPIFSSSFTVEKQFKFKLGDWPSEVQLNGDGTKLYWLNKDVWQMDVTANRIPVRPFLEYQNTLYYGLTVNPANGECTSPMPSTISSRA